MRSSRQKRKKKLSNLEEANRSCFVPSLLGYVSDIVCSLNDAIDKLIRSTPIMLLPRPENVLQLSTTRRSHARHVCPKSPRIARGRGCQHGQTKIVQKRCPATRPVSRCELQAGIKVIIAAKDRGASVYLDGGAASSYKDILNKKYRSLRLSIMSELDAISGLARWVKRFSRKDLVVIVDHIDKLAPGDALQLVSWEKSQADGGWVIVILVGD